MGLVKNARNRKGWVRLIEAVLASTIVFGFIVFLTSTQLANEEVSDWSKITLRTAGEDALHALDASDVNANTRSDLREYLLAGDWTSIESRLNSSVPRNIGYALYFYNDSTSGLEFKAGEVDTGVSDLKEKVSVWYPIAGDYGSHCDSERACALRLLVWMRLS